MRGGSPALLCNLMDEQQQQSAMSWTTAWLDSRCEHEGWRLRRDAAERLQHDTDSCSCSRMDANGRAFLQADALSRVNALAALLSAITTEPWIIHVPETLLRLTSPQARFVVKYDQLSTKDIDVYLDRCPYGTYGTSSGRRCLTTSAAAQPTNPEGAVIKEPVMQTHGAN